MQSNLSTTKKVTFGKGQSTQRTTVGRWPFWEVGCNISRRAEGEESHSDLTYAKARVCQGRCWKTAEIQAYKELKRASSFLPEQQRRSGIMSEKSGMMKTVYFAITQRDSAACNIHQPRESTFQFMSRHQSSFYPV